MPKTLVARWQSQRGKYWLELYHDELGYTFKHDSGGGNLGAISEEAALGKMTEWLTRNHMGTLKLVTTCMSIQT